MFDHHAVLFEGVSVGTVVDQLAQFDAATEMYLVEQNALGIDVVRALIERAHRSPATGYERLCLVVGFESATTEAQNALLKILEEPPITTRLVLCVPNRSILLPTILSRLLVGQSSSAVVASQVPELLSLPLNEALALIEDRHKQKDKSWFVTQQQALVAWGSSIQLHLLPAAPRTALLEVLARLNTRGASNRWLLEHLVISYATHRRVD